MGLSYLLPHIAGLARAAELLFTGRVFSSSAAVALGIANHAVGPEDVPPNAREIAAEIVTCALVVVRMMKRSFSRAQLGPANRRRS